MKSSSLYLCTATRLGLSTADRLREEPAMLFDFTNVLLTSWNTAELNNEMLRRRYEVNNAGSSARGLEFGEICGKKRGWDLKTGAFCYR